MPLGAIGWGLVAAAGVGAVGANMAANTQAGAQEQAAQTQMDMFNKINAQEQPFIQGGYGAEARLNYLMGLTPQDAQGNPIRPAGAPGGAPGSAGIPGYDPSSGYQITPGGGITQLLPGGTAAGGGRATWQQGMPLSTAAAMTTPSGVPGAVPGSTGNPSDYGSFSRSFSPQDFLNNVDPGYAFQLQTGANAVRSADTPGVGALSGAALKDLMSFNQGMAATGYQNAFNRFTTQQNNIFARLSGLAGMGQNAASQVGTAGTSLGTGIAQAQAGAGASRAGGIVGATNALGGAAVPYASMLQGGGRGGYDPYLTSTLSDQSMTDIGNQVGYPAPIGGGS